MKLKTIFSSFLTLSVCISPVIFLFIDQPVLGQNNCKNTEIPELKKKSNNSVNQRDWERAISSYQETLKIFECSENNQGIVDTLNEIGGIYSTQRKWEAALNYYQQALEKSNLLGDHFLQAKIRNNIASIYLKKREYQLAFNFLTQALEDTKKSGNLSSSLDTEILNNRALIYGEQGELPKALESLKVALDIAQKNSDSEGKIKSFDTFGLVYAQQGKFELAKKSFQDALSNPKIDSFRKAVIQNHIADVHSQLGKGKKALKLYEEDLRIFQRPEIEDHLKQADTLNKIGLVYFKQAMFEDPQNKVKNLGQAEKSFTDSLEITRKIDDSSEKVDTLNNLGLVYLEQNNFTKANESFQEVLKIAESLNYSLGQAKAKNNMGLIYQKQGNFNQAQDSFTQALTIVQKIGDRVMESEIFSNIALTYQKNSKKQQEAIKNWEESFKIILEIRRGLIREDRQSFLAIYQRPIANFADLLIKDHQSEEAYKWINRLTTFDLADYRSLENVKNIPSEEAQKAINELNKSADDIKKLFTLVEENHNVDLALAEQIQDAAKRYNQEAETIINNFPEIAERFETDFIVPREKIPEGFTVIHPVLLNDSIAIFVMTKDKFDVIKSPVKPQEFNNLLNDTYSAISNRLDPNYLDKLSKLYDDIINPIEPKLKEYKTKAVSVIAQGKLRNIPLEALYDNKQNKYLIETYPINYLTRLSSRSFSIAKTPASLKVLALGNPRPDKFNLPGTETEVNGIVEIFPGSEPPLIKGQATVEKFKNLSINYPLIHLATHGCFQAEKCPDPKPGLESNTLLFADGNYRIADAAFLSLSLINTELVTLSGCQTAVNTNSNGEEIGGLAYFFERAGAKSVIATLWSVDDQETPKLMIDFYKHLKDGMSKTEALQQSKLRFIERNEHPYYWAPFILIGNPGMAQNKQQ